MPTVRQLDRAHAVYERRETRGVVYRVSLELIELARRGTTTTTVTEALVVLLQSWNARYYVSQHRGRFPRAHVGRLGRLLDRHAAALERYRARALESLTADDRARVEALFTQFEALLGPVGAGKALHLLAPRFFPLWDRKIAAAKRCRLGTAGTNAPRYWRFMVVTRDDCVALGGEVRHGTDLLKRLDEFNYCRKAGYRTA
jgi:hypothetical protein